jgi:RsiW-degrading membrane proteinase PrsW (M82 family)
VLLVLSGNPNLFPTVVLIGSLLVPVAYVSFFYERRAISPLTMPAVARAFFYGGVLGAFAATILEPIILGPFAAGGLTIALALGVGLIEEFAKILGVLFVSRRHRHNTMLNGMILGAAAGMGFAAVESLGYAFTAFLRSRGDLTLTVAIVLLRGVLSPFGHGTWTAIFAGVLYRESAPGDFRLTGKVLIAYLAVVLLHALWDGLPWLLSFFSSPQISVPVGELIVGLTGLIILWRLWRQARRLQGVASSPAASLPPEPVSGELPS